MPSFVKYLLKKILSSRNSEYLLGDFEELFCAYEESKGKSYALIWIIFQVVKSIPSIIYYKSYWGGIMVKSYILITLRHFRKQKFYSLINVIGLALSLSAVFLIYLWVSDELSYDNFHRNIDNIYRIESTEKYSDKDVKTIMTPVPLKEELHTIPEIRYSTRFTRFGGIQVRNKDKTYHENFARSADSEFFKVFSFNLIKGDPDKALVDKNSAVIAQKIAEKYFGDENPLGKTLIIENRFNLKITGVFDKFPANNSFPFDILVPFQFVKEDLERMPRGWGNAISTFVLLKEFSEVKGSEKKLNDLVASKSEKTKSLYNLKNLSDVHLYSNIGNNESIGDIKYVYIFSSIAVFVLLVACINFMNLSTAKAMDRVREVGMRKVNGADKNNLRFQFLAESFIMVVLSGFLSFLIVLFVLPLFNGLTNKSIEISNLFTPDILLGLLIIILLTGLVSGSYPAFYLAGFDPIQVFQEKIISAGKNSLFRRTLVIVQFAISVILIVGAFIVKSQLDYINNKPLGYDKENLLTILIPGSAKPKIDIIKNKFLEFDGIKGIAATGRHPVLVGDYARDIDYPGRPKDQNIKVIFHTIDYDYLETLNIKVVEGTGFRKGFADDSIGVMLNQTALETLGIKDPIGKEFKIFNGYVKTKIIGIFEDFHHQSLVNKIEPMILMMKPNMYWLSNFVVKTKSMDLTKLLSDMENTWKDIVPNTAFTYSFVDEAFETVYTTQTRLGKIFNIFSSFAIFIACLGLLGLVTFTAEQKTKEIGIRKVLGAGIFDVVKLVSKEMIILVLIGVLISLPVAYYIFNMWLTDFSYRVDFNFFYLFLATLLVLCLTLITVVAQSIKAAIKNPVDSLKYE